MMRPEARTKYGKNTKGKRSDKKKRGRGEPRSTGYAGLLRSPAANVTGYTGTARATNGEVIDDFLLPNFYA